MGSTEPIYPVPGIRYSAEEALLIQSKSSEIIRWVIAETGDPVVMGTTLNDSNLEEIIKLKK